MADYLPHLAAKARARVRRGYYDNHDETVGKSSRSLVKTIQECKNTPIITEIKYSSPSAGKIRKFESPLKIAEAMLNGGACGISVLTDPEYFEGDIDVLAIISGKLDVPVIMKDIIVSPKQVLSAGRSGARGIVLISEIFSRGLATVSLGSIIHEASRLGLEVLAEANSVHEFMRLRRYKPNLYGINNRNLSTFQVDLSTTERILTENRNIDRPVISESGIKSPQDIRRLKAAGAHAFLIGTSIMRSLDIEQKVSKLVNS